MFLFYKVIWIWEVGVSVWLIVTEKALVFLNSFSLNTICSFPIYIE